MAEQFCDNCGAANPETARHCQYCGSLLLFKRTTGELTEHTMLAGRYQLERRIGQGGMGAVYKATDSRFNGRSVAIKEMSRAGLSPTSVQEAEEAFEREARILADLQHPNLPRIYDYFTENERSYLVMDFIEGETLEAYVERASGKPLPLNEVLVWGEQLCAVLNYLHTHQPPIIFRDLKPSNVMISEKGEQTYVYLIDFGIARIFKPGQSHDTVALGSPGYAAPEQYGKAQSTPRSDIYSLGALLHCLLTGVDPSEQPFFFRPASELNPAVPQELSDLLHQMLNMNSDQRPASAQEVAQVLRRIDQQRAAGTLVYSLPDSVPTKLSSKANSAMQNAYTLYSQRRLDDATAAYERVLKDDDQNPQAWQGRGLTLALRGKHREALQSFEQALKIDPRLVTSLNGKGSALNFLRRYREALDTFERALTIEPDNALAWNGKGTAQNALNQPEQALKSFDLALHFDSRLAQAWNNKGLVLRQLHRYQEALNACDQATTYERNNATYWNSKGLVLYDMGRLNDAQKAFQEATRLNPNYAPAWYGLGNILYAQHSLPGAKDAFNRAVKLDPKFVRAWDRLGNVLSDQGEFSRAIDAYNEAIRVDGKYAPAYNGKANAWLKLGRYDLALDAYERAVRLNPKIALAWNGLGNAYYHAQDYNRALDAYDHALQLNHTMPSAWFNKSLVLKKLGQREEALVAADEAVSIAPYDPDNWDRKADAHRQLRQRRDAHDAEQHAKRLRGEA
jgi:tetratricopeptide (TPR) repeat protein/tRNA A-37 threonylcarbamoyl transferase component Bud32